MSPTYEITVKIKTPDGFKDIGSFTLGTDLKLALSTFDSLKAESNGTDTAIRLCLMEKNGETSCKQIRNIGCILKDFAANSMIILRDAFKFYSLEHAI